MITPEELIIEMMPFPRELKEFCKTHPDFGKALKIIYFDRFITLQAVGTSYSPNFPEDEVIGIYVYDYGLKDPKFKQDFIINKGGQKKEFILFTGLSSVVDNKQIRHINEFLSTYGKGGYYKDAHHPKFEEFSEELKERAVKAIALGDKRKKEGFVKITMEQAQEIYKKLQKLPKSV
ncbi:MAG: hypothetical protein Q7R49_00145 [Candidatus Daviesbacteria bacterium]|nr:hypothetical protein [Candidatus Daviesbacteria bacterium]